MKTTIYGTISEPKAEDMENGHNYYYQQRDSKLHTKWFVPKLEWLFTLTNIILEILVLIFDRLASPSNPKYGLIVWELCLAVMCVCIAELIYRGLVKEKMTLIQCLKSLIPCSSSEKQPYSFVDLFVLAGAKVQMVVSSISYGYLLKGKQSPIKVFLVSFIFIVCFAIYKLINKRNRNRNDGQLIPVRQDDER